MSVIQNTAVEYPLESNSCRVGLMANFRNGRPEGVAWQTLIGGGMLYGELNTDSRDFTGLIIQCCYDVEM